MYFQSINGKKSAHISINDRGLAYGDGIFTTAKIDQGTVKLLNQHIERLVLGSKVLGIQAINYEQLKSDLIVVADQYECAVLKVIITAGEGGRGYSRKGVSKPTIIIKVSEYPAKYNEWHKTGITLSDASLQLGINPLLAGIKHLNRLEQVLLRNELEHTLFDDLLVCDVNNNLVETTCANFFWLEGEQLYTPEIIGSGVAGLIRAEIISQFPETQILSVTKERIQQADAMFITNSVMEIMPVKQYNKTYFSIDCVREFMTNLKY